MTDNTFTVQTWDEHIVSGSKGTPRVAHAHATYEYAGLIEGASIADALLYYAETGDDGDSTSFALERIEGTVEGRKGSFIVRHEYRISAATHHVSSTFTVVPGSATGELTGMTGSGTTSGASQTMNYTFEPVFG